MIPEQGGGETDGRTTWELRHRTLLLVIPLAVGVLLRIYPYLLYHVPYSTDSWSPIRNAEVLLANSPTQLGGNGIFDNYNVYWPANSVFGAAASLILGAPPIQIMPLVMPIAASMTLLIFFLLAEKLTQSTLAASIATTLFATAGFYSIFSAAVTKEGFATPFYMLCLYLLLLKKTDLASISLFSISSLVLVISHHATAFVFLGSAGAIIIVEAILANRRGRSVGRTFIFFLITAIMGIFYYILYAANGLGALEGIVSAQNFLVMLSFFTVLLLPTIYFTLGPAGSKARPPIAEISVMLIVLVVLLVSTRVNLIPLEPTLPPELIFFALPYVLVGFLAIIGHRIMQGRNRESFAFLAGWLAALLAFEGFAGFGGNFVGLDLVYRLFDFLYAPAALFASVAAVYWIRNLSTSLRILKPFIIVLVIGIASASAYQTYAASVQQSNLLGGHWVYHESDLSSGEWLRRSAGPSGIAGLSGDSRETYILRDYYGLNVSMQIGYEYLSGISKAPPHYMMTYALMEINGYVLDPYAFELPDGWVTLLHNGSSIYYTNGNDVLWAAP